ncbi:MAG TPA: hypothetical protein VL180_12000 [Burkholderiales bacterium]|nr:hypothetical protein [Burkholderiales bacterium]
MASSRPDLSSAAINTAVVSRSLQHPSFVYPAAIGALGGLGALLFGGPLLTAGAAVAAAAAAVGFGVNCVLRREAIAKEYVEYAHSQILAERTAMLQELEQDLKKAANKDATRQFERFREKIRAFEEVLGDKLQTGELTYARFLGIAEQVYLSAIDNLRGVVAAARSEQAIDESYIGGRIAEIERAANRSEAKERELAGLKEQLRIDTEQKAKIERLLAQNEEALGRFDAAIAAIGDMKTGAEGATMDMESAMSELARIAKRARDYT